MRVLYTPLPGTVTLQMSDVDIRVRPNAAKTVGKAILKGLNEFIQNGIQLKSEVGYREGDFLVECRESFDRDTSL